MSVDDDDDDDRRLQPRQLAVLITIVTGCLLSGLVIAAWVARWLLRTAVSF